MNELIKGYEQQLQLQIPLIEKTRIIGMLDYAKKIQSGEIKQPRLPYYCWKCRHEHKYYSKIGKDHLKYNIENY